METKRIIPFFLALFLLISCSQEEHDISEVKPTTNYRITLEEAKINAIAFAKNAVLNTRGNVNSQFEICTAYPVTKKKVMTRGTSQLGYDTLYYVINFENNQGFIIASADKRQSDILAYVENGNYEETDTSNVMFMDYMAALENEFERRSLVPEDNGLQKHDPYIDGNRGSDRYSYEKVLPRLTTTWGQYSPYNMFCPGREKGYATGCVATAITQICSFLEQPTSTSYPGPNGEVYFDLNWPEILQEIKDNKGIVKYNTPSGISVAHLMRFWGHHFHSKYGVTTSANGKDAINRVRKLGLNSTKLMDYNETKIVDALRKPNHIIFMGGYPRYYHVAFVIRKYVDGHAWVVDGFIRRQNGGSVNLYLHCNWGWGGKSNGYFLSSYLNVADPNAEYDNPNWRKYDNINYQYKREMAILWK